jgi:hypothetical protein
MKAPVAVRAASGSWGQVGLVAVVASRVGSAKPGSRRVLVAVLGAVALLAGIGLLWYGLSPSKQLMDAVGPVFSGGEPPEDLSERMDAAMAKLKARVIIDGIGFVLLLGGFVMIKAGLAKPQKSVAQLVDEEVTRRMAVSQASPSTRTASEAAMPTQVAPTSPGPTVPAPPSAASAPAAAPIPVPMNVPVPAPVPQPATPVARRTHCAACGSILVAGGRLCPRGHAQA